MASKSTKQAIANYIAANIGPRNQHCSDASASVSDDHRAYPDPRNKVRELDTREISYQDQPNRVNPDPVLLPKTFKIIFPSRTWESLSDAEKEYCYTHEIASRANFNMLQQHNGCTPKWWFGCSTDEVKPLSEKAKNDIANMVRERNGYATAAKTNSGAPAKVSTTDPTAALAEKIIAANTIGTKPYVDPAVVQSRLQKIME